jgi:hypothetical protein
MKPSLILGSALVGAFGLLAGPTVAQVTGQQGAMSILNRLPPDVYAKLQALAQMLDQSIKEGKIPEADVHRELLSGQLGNMLATVNPEAGRLLDELSEAMRAGNGPGPESLMPLLGGLR